MAKNYKTIALTGTEQKVALAGQNCDIRNDSVDVVYASAEAGITSGADGVLSIPAGQAAKLLDCRGTLYILGTGSVMLCGNDYSELVFKTAATSSGEGGGTVDGVARQAIASHANNTDIHLTAEKAIEAAATAISNPNLLINPDFKINQRGTTAVLGGWGVDCWYGEYTVADKNIVFSKTEDFAMQRLENYDDFIGKSLTVSVYYDDGTSDSGTCVVSDNEEYFFIGDRTHALINTETGNRCFILWANSACAVKKVKLELSTIATPFTPPNFATELVKCQRYYQIRTTGDIDPVDLRPSMATIADIREREDGKYEYIAEL